MRQFSLIVFHDEEDQVNFIKNSFPPPMIISQSGKITFLGYESVVCPEIASKGEITCSDNPEMIKAIKDLANMVSNTNKKLNSGPIVISCYNVEDKKQDEIKKK